MEFHNYRDRGRMNITMSAKTFFFPPFRAELLSLIKRLLCYNGTGYRYFPDDTLGSCNRSIMRSQRSLRIRDERHLTPTSCDRDTFC